jgi:hypothetical protein
MSINSRFEPSTTLIPSRSELQRQLRISIGLLAVMACITAVAGFTTLSSSAHSAQDQQSMTIRLASR